MVWVLILMLSDGASVETTRVARYVSLPECKAAGEKTMRALAAQGKPDGPLRLARFACKRETLGDT